MRYRAYWVHHGPSIYSHCPVIRYQLDWASAGDSPPDLSSIAHRLLTDLPGLREHPCDVQALLRREGDGDDRALLPHLFEHLCIELQNLTGAQLACVRASGIRIGRDDAVIPYEDERTGVEAGRVSLEFIASLWLADPSTDCSDRLQAFFQFAHHICTSNK